MTAVHRLVYRQVGAIPESLASGVLYHAPAYHVATHLCACGCGYEVVTRVDGRWVLNVGLRGPSLWPSIGNASFPCRSHYFVTNGLVRWAGKYTDEMIAMARERDNPRAHAKKIVHRTWLGMMLAWFRGARG